jgi:hypothetical protein
MIEYASLDPQRKIGLGMSYYINNGSFSEALITGATAGIGNGSGFPEGGEDGRCSVTYRGEENLWGNIWTWLDCVNIVANYKNEVWVTKIGTTPVDDTTEGYECLDAYATHSEGFISAFGIDPQHPEILIPTETSGSDTFADYAWQEYTAEGIRAVRFGGCYYDGSRCGFSLELNAFSSNFYHSIGGRLLYVPQSTV